MLTQWVRGAKCATIAGSSFLLMSAFGQMAFCQLQPPTVKADDKLDAEVVIVTPTGPDRTTIKRVAGPFVLFFFNRSGEATDTFSLVLKPIAVDKLTGDAASLLDLHATSSSQRDHQLIFPLPGDYQIRFKSHPEWLVNLSITAK